MQQKSHGTGQAFAMARNELAAWEKRDGYTPSEPQIDAGAGIAAKLMLWEKQSPVGDALPFQPAAIKPKRAVTATQ